MGHNVVNFVEGYVLGSENGGNLKPLKITKNGIYYPADYDCNGFSQVDVDIPNKSTQIDMLPTWAEVIIDDGWSIKIKRSDKIENTDRFDFDSKDGNLYLKTYQRTWTIYFCVYNNGQLLFGNTAGSYTSKQWTWHPAYVGQGTGFWLNVYAGHELHNITNISAEKTSADNGFNIYIDFEVEWFFIRYNPMGEVEAENHSLNTSGNGGSLAVSDMNNTFSFYAKDDYQKRAEDIIAYSQAVARSEKIECKVYNI